MKPARELHQSGPGVGERFDLVGMRKTPGAFFANMFETLGKPEWLLEGTPFAIENRIPKEMSVRDYIIMNGNLASRREFECYHINYLIAGVPLYYGALNIGLRHAPNILSVIELIIQYGGDRPGYHSHRLTDIQGGKSFELIQMTDLGHGRAILVETPLLHFYQIVSGQMGRPAREMIIDMAHCPPPYAVRLREMVECQIRFDAGRDAIFIPEAICLQPSLTYDSELWRIAQIRCSQEAQERKKHDGDTSAIRTAIVQVLSNERHVPRVEQTAKILGLSGRTLLRHLRKEGYTYQQLVDEIMQHRSKALLADSKLSIAEISEELCFPDDSGFHRRFRRWFGMTPTEYRRKVLSL